MLQRWLPREVKFFQRFLASADELVEACKDYRLLLKNPAQGKKYVDAIQAHELKADEISHGTMNLLHETFITPIDREDIHSLCTRMDDIIDLIFAASQRLWLFEVKTAPYELEALSDICIQVADSLRQILGRLEKIKDPAQIIELCHFVHKLEDDADNLLRQGIAKLYREENDIKNLLKLKEILELTEQATDRGAEVANIVEGIVLEYG